MFVERDKASGRDMKWYSVDELPPATRGAMFVIYEMPTERRIDSFRVKGTRVNLSLDNGRYILVHSHGDNWWQRYVSIDCSKQEYDEVRDMLKKSIIRGIHSIVTTEGTVRRCTFPGCDFTTMSSMESVRHVRAHGTGTVLPVGIYSHPPVEPLEDTGEGPVKVAPVDTPKRASLKAQMERISKEV